MNRPFPFKLGIQTIHVSDNNRYFPGLGAIDFPAILSSLYCTGYDGILTIEGRTTESFEEDLKIASDFLRHSMTGKIPH